MISKVFKTAMYSTLGIVLLIAACNSNDIVENGYKTLKSSEDFYVSAQGAMQTALDAGAMDKATAININACAEVYKDAFQVAKVALQSYKEAVDIKDDANIKTREVKLKAAMEDLSVKITVLKNAIMPYLAKKVEVANG